MNTHLHVCPSHVCVQSGTNHRDVTKCASPGIVQTQLLSSHSKLHSSTIETLIPLPILLILVPFCHANRGYADELICSITSDHFNLTLASDGASLTGNTFSAYPILIVTFNKDNFMNAQDPIDWEAEKSDRGEYKGYSC